MEFLENRAGVKVEPFIADLIDVESAISEQYGKSLGTEVSAALEEVSGGTTKIEEHLKDLDKAAETIRDAPVSRIVATLLEYAVKSRASDIHIEPQEDRTRVRYRIDGVLQERITLPKKVHDSLVSRIKILSDLKIDDYVVVIGEPNAVGQIEAKLIRILPPPPVSRPLDGQHFFYRNIIIQ